MKNADVGALPSCEIKFICKYEERPWPPPPVH